MAIWQMNITRTFYSSFEKVLTDQVYRLLDNWLICFKIVTDLKQSPWTTQISREVIDHLYGRAARCCPVSSEHLAGGLWRSEILLCVSGSRGLQLLEALHAVHQTPLSVHLVVTSPNIHSVTALLLLTHHCHCINSKS